MDSFEKCLEPLKVLIANGDENAIGLAEKAIDEYLATFPALHMKLDALHKLQEAITPLWATSKGAQTEFINMVLEYTDNRWRALENAP